MITLTIWFHKLKNKEEMMAGYTAIADIGNALTELLRLNIVPEVLANEESIGVCSPEDKGDFLLGLYLYDIKQSEVFRNSEMQIMDSKRQKYPPVNLELYYMLTAYSNGDVKFRSLEEHKILGKIPLQQVTIPTKPRSRSVPDVAVLNSQPLAELLIKYQRLPRGFFWNRNFPVLLY